MKHIINYLGALLAVVLIGATFTACAEDDEGSANVGLGIKTFFPTKVVTNQPMTINGSGFSDVTEIEFPGGIKVSNFEIVGNDMIRVDAPAGIPADGGKIVVRTADDEAESRLPLTLGHTVVSGFSKQPGEEASGGELIEVYGTDLEFIKSVELLDAEGEPQMIDHKDFARKGTSKLVFRVPLKNIFEGTFIGSLYTYDGQKIALPELAYKPAADEGHWEIVKTVYWKNEAPERTGVINWSGTYRFGLDGTDGNSECIATFPADVWENIKTQKFYMLFKPDGDSYQIRVTNGWWDVQWLGKDNDIAPWNMAERIIDNGDGTYYIEVDLGDDPLVATLDQKHLLFTGSGYTVLELYAEEEIWIDGPGDQEVKNTFWANDGSGGSINWSGTYRFGLDGTDGNSECIATFPEDVWNKMKTESFYMRFKPDGDSYQIRVTNGWWDVQWLGKDNDIAPWNMAERIIDNGDGTYYIEVNFGDDPLVGTLDQKHLLFTGSGYTVLELYFIDIVPGGGGGSSSFDLSQYVSNHSGTPVSYPYTFTWDDNGRFNLPSDLLLNEFKVKSGSIFRVTKTAGNTGQVQINDTSWTAIDYLADWAGDVEVMEKVFDDDMMNAVNNGGLIIQGDLKGITKIEIVP